MLIFSVIKEVERIGDLMTNITEEIIFLREAEVVKHRKKNSETKKGRVEKYRSSEVRR
ncbi:hypothetical protein [Gillisia limnaea]|uniref:hypothetical protein n=1 Tax=Gillisia limnaea TaxID=195907 RepID=UPI00030F7D42|nr:hypothetical protein [Gillisia limnaea]